MAELLVPDIDDAIWQRFKAKAAAEGKSEEQAALDLIEKYLDNQEADARANAAAPPRQF